MFANIRIQDIGGTAVRHSIPTGAVFKYQGGQGYSYLSLGVYEHFFMACKLESVNAIANFTITPFDSLVANRDCDVTGVFGFVLDLSGNPQIGSSQRAFRFGSVISLAKDVDDDGNSHLYLTIGNRPDRHINEQLLLRLTGQGTTKLFKTVPSDSIIAVRGTAALNVEYLERKA
jgi:hypothetical protein